MKPILIAVTLAALLPGCEGHSESATRMLWAASKRCDSAPVRAQVTEADGEMVFEARCRIAPTE